MRVCLLYAGVEGRLCDTRRTDHLLAGRGLEEEVYKTAEEALEFARREVELKNVDPLESRRSSSTG
jgi:hypothetical protein